MHVYSRHHAGRFTSNGGSVTYDGARAFIGRSGISAENARARLRALTIALGCYLGDQKTPIARPRSSELAF